MEGVANIIKSVWCA